MTPYDAMFVQIHASNVMFNGCKRHPKITDTLVRESCLITQRECAMILRRQPLGDWPEHIAGYTLKLPSDPTSH